MTAEGPVRNVLEKLLTVPGTLSVSAVGSWVDGPPAAAIGDVDVVVVGERLTPAYFRAVGEAAARLTPSDFGLPAERIRINDSLGPLKYNEPGTMVLHLMLYDREGHREHVLKSPFTCLDWERSPHHAGLSLAALYPVLSLQPRDFLASRRGLRDYIDDLERGGVSYRRYAAEGDRMVQKTEWRPLEGRQRLEFSYHIIRNLVANYVKFVTRSNVFLKPPELEAAWAEHLPALLDFKAPFLRLREAKMRQTDLPDMNPAAVAREFVAAFESFFQAAWGDAVRVVFVRHAATELNDGSFLGRRRDPPLRDASVLPLLAPLPDRVITSPLLRARQTAAALAPGLPAEADERLLEIEYGEVEGARPAELKARFPALVEGWARGLDLRFPGGENTADVRARLESFLDSLPVSGSRRILVVTHNVVLRCLAGLLYGIPLKDWHRIRIDHLAELEVVLRNGRIYPDFATGVKARITDSLPGMTP